MVGIEGYIPPDDIIEKVRSTTLWQSDIRPYQHAQVAIKDLSIESFRPLQRYALRGNVAFQAALRAELLEADCDTLQLNGGVLLNNDGYHATLVPPIIERDENYGDCLVDGTHRVYMARQIGLQTIRAIHILNVPSEHPLLAFPSDWSDMIEYDTTPPEGPLKRLYRPGDPVKLRRDFGPLNGSLRREVGSAV